MNRRDAIDAERDLFQPQQCPPLKGGWFRPPLPRSFLCTAIVEVVRRLRRIFRKEIDRGIRGTRGRRTGKKSGFRVFCVFRGKSSPPSVAALPRCAHRVSAVHLRALRLDKRGSDRSASVSRQNAGAPVPMGWQQGRRGVRKARTGREASRKAAMRSLLFLD